MKTIEEKAKAYDNALEKARKLCAYPTTKPFISDLQEIFPELAESEDEKIRKALIQNLKERFGTKGTMGEGLDMPNVLAWLEKHKYTEEDLDKAYKCADEIQYRRGYEDAKKEIEKQGEKNPAWSEEDETT